MSRVYKSQFTQLMVDELGSGYLNNKFDALNLDEFVEDGLDAIVESILEGLAHGKKMTIKGFGTLEVSRRERFKVNPKTQVKGPMYLKNYVMFKPSKEQMKIHAVQN